MYILYTYEISKSSNLPKDFMRFQDFTKDFKFLRKIFKISRDFKISQKISRLRVGFQGFQYRFRDFRKDLEDCNGDFQLETKYFVIL